MRARFASNEVSLRGGLVCQPDSGGDSPQMLVRSKNRRVMSKEFGVRLGSTRREKVFPLTFIEDSSTQKTK